LRGERRKMKAIIYDKSASPDRLILRELEKPIPNKGQVLVMITAVSVS